MAGVWEEFGAELGEIGTRVVLENGASYFQRDLALV